MKRAIVLSAGLGTRLRPLTDWVPKPLVWIGDKPQIDHILGRLAVSGFESAVVNTHHLHEQFDDAWAGRQPLRVGRVFEEKILGTGGAISNARSVLGPGEVLVYNGDILADVDFAKLRDAHAEAGDGVTIVVANPCPRGGGTVGLDAHDKVVRLRGEVFGEEVIGTDYLGALVLGDELRARLPPEGCLVGDGLLPWLRSGRRVATFHHQGGFKDTGTLEAYLEANLAWLGARSHFASPSAKVDRGVRLERSVVLEGAEVTGADALRECIVWPGARATTPLERTVVTLRGVVEIPK